MPATEATSHVSTDLLWFLIRGYNSQIEKRKQSGIPTLSREKGNLKNLHSYKYSGLIHPKSFGVVPAANGKGVEIITRRGKAQVNQVGKSTNKRTLRPNSGGRRTNKIVEQSVKNYRPDLRAAAAKRASKILQSQKQHKPLKARKPRGPKAAKLAAAE